MNRIDRLFATLLLLQSKKRIRSQDLSAQFGISKRTVYRDVAALMEMGVPILSLPGEGYEMMSGFYLPPLLFTPDEAGALFLGAQMLIQQAEGSVVGEVEGALGKITAVLPLPSRQKAERLTEIIRFFSENGRFNLDDPHLLTLQRAILEQRAIRIQYHSYNKNETTERVVDPYQLFYSNGIWYVEGYCHLRQAMRAFRLDRVDELDLLLSSFEKQTHPSPRTDSLVVSDTIAVKIRFDADIVRWVSERQHYGFVGEETATSTALSTGVNGTVMSYAVHTLQEIIPWLRGWGAAAEPLSPPELRRQIHENALKLAKMLT